MPLFFVLLGIGLLNGGSVEITRHTLWLNQPADKWYEGFPIGNGRLGTLVESDLNETFIINEDTLWPKPENRDMKGAYKNLDKIKKLLQEGKYTEAEELTQHKFIKIDKLALANRPLCKIMLQMHKDENTEFYRRYLEMDKGIVTLNYKKNGVTYTRTYFSSYPDQVLVIRIVASKAKAISCSFSVEGFEGISSSTKKKLFLFRGESGAGGTGFTGAIKVLIDQGSVKYDKAGVHVKNASSLTFYLTVGTDYYGKNSETVAIARQDKLKKMSYEEIQKRHVADFKSIFNRADIKVGKESGLTEMSTSERLEAEIKGADDALLASQMFQMGRYILMSASRPGTMPSHLHGLWIKDFAPSYNCAYHINVNIQLNYQIAEVGNMTETHLPLFDLIDRLRPNGRITAKEVFGRKGFVLQHNVDGTLVTGPFGEVQYGFWPIGHGWVCQNLWDHFLFTQDKKWLKEKGFPIMREAAEFIQDYLMENPDTGKLIFGPSTSPENFYFTSEGKKARLMTGIAMDQSITQDLFENCIEAARILGLNDPFMNTLKKSLARLEKPVIGKNGRILEWRRPLKEAQPYHRHVSHLYGTYPAALYTQDRNPELMEAAIKSLDERWVQREKKGYRGPGWATVINIPMYARYKMTKEAYKMFKLVYTERFVHKNLMGSLNPNKHGVYIDINGGTAAGMIEMMMQSHRGFIEFLPALPVKWNDGSFRGIRARGGFEIDLEWKGGKWKKAVVLSSTGNLFRLAGYKKVKVQTGGKNIKYTINKKNIIEFQTQAGKTYTIINK